MTFINTVLDAAPPSAMLYEQPRRLDARAEMQARLPRFVQPFLTWLTARPGPGETVRDRPAWSFVLEAALWCLAGVAATLWSMQLQTASALGLGCLGMLATCCGLGFFQVVVFHHCSHGTVFRTRARNRMAGRMISALLLFKQFDAYQAEHMLHHSAKKLLTEEDEFANFVFQMCGLAPSLPKDVLWRRLLLCLVSPRFHAVFLIRRVRASLFSADRAHNRFGMAVWLAAFAAAFAAGGMAAFLLAWVLPVTILLQIATVFRILCEHRFPEPSLIALRGREFVCRATAGVFAGRMPPACAASLGSGVARWTLWWLDMLTVQLLVRLFVLVGDAPCHDFHHRRPATRRWTSYIQARQNDVDAGCPGFPLNYGETWGLFRAIDENLATLSMTPREAIAGPRDQHR